MATVREESAGRSSEGLSSRQDCDSGEALTEWRSCEQVETGTPSTSPPYWDTDDSDDDGGLKPCDLYGKYTWKIEKFSTINKRELKSSVFEVGGYRWYILIYPQGCDVCNHLSLFLCVANHDKLLPGWSHFAQFTIAVVNKDPKKSKYSDTLHRFWKKEHDWGWKKFMELSKVSDGFLDADTLIIKAQVQYRRELVRVYLTNVEQICRRFVDDRRGKLENLLEDKARWSSFCSFWLEIDQSARHLMSSEKMESILKMIVKHFFIEKDVTSTLVIDSLYSGFKALKGQSKCIIGKDEVLEGVDIPPPVIQVEEEMFVLVDDVLLLLERATMEPLPPKDEKGPQNRTKDGGAGEDFTKDSIERDERRLTELGRRTVEIFVLTHIFSSKIEAAYQEAIALKRQEELIREEKAESEQRAKREIAGKEKRLKKKQSKQKRNNRKAKDKLKDEKLDLMSEDKHIHEIPAEVKYSLGEPILDRDETLEDVSDVSDSVEYSADALQPDSEDRDSSPVNWDTEMSELLPPEASSSAVGNDMSSLHLEGDMRSSSVMDDSSSTSSTDSAPSLVTNLSYKGNSSIKNKSKNSPTRGKNQRGAVKYGGASASKEVNRLISGPVKDLQHQHHTFVDKVAVSSEYEAAAESSLKDVMNQSEPSTAKKEEDILHKNQSNVNQGDCERQKKVKASTASNSPQSSPKKAISTFQPNSEPKDIPAHVSPASKMAANSMQLTNKAASAVNRHQPSNTSKLDSTNTPLPKPTEKRSGQQPSYIISRPLSTPPIPGSKPAVTPIVSKAQTTPVLSRSMSATGRLGPDPLPAKHSYSPPSYKNAILGNVTVSSSSFSQPPPSPSSAVNMSPSLSPVPSPPLSFSKSSSTLVPGPIYIPQAAERVMLKTVDPGISYSAAAREAVLHGGRQQWLGRTRIEAPNRSLPFDPPSMLSDIQNLELNSDPINTRSRNVFQSNLSVSTSGRQTTQVADEFPHLDIINDLLNDEQGSGSGRGRPDQRFSLPTDLSVPVGLGSSNGSCRFEQMYYEDFIQPDYTRPGNNYDTLPEYIPYNNIPYMNGHIDGNVQNQWPIAGYDQHSVLNMVNSGTGDWYAYGVPEYSDLACGLNGYTMFRPSNGQ
ncbi:hypothetical protein V2J09_015814 [Rumex salicifolius]